MAEGTVGAKGEKSKTSCMYGSEVYDQKIYFLNRSIRLASRPPVLSWGHDVKNIEIHFSRNVLHFPATLVSGGVKH